MTAIEHKELKGITVRNFIVTIASTASIVASVMTTYFGLRSDIHDIKTQQEAQTRVFEIRLRFFESEVSVLQQQVNQIRTERIGQSKPFHQ